MPQLKFLEKQITKTITFFLVGELQSDLQLIGSAVATPNSSASERKMAQVKFNPEKVTRLENLIDEFDAQLPPLTTFILCLGLFTAKAIITTFLTRFVTITEKFVPPET